MAALPPTVLGHQQIDVLLGLPRQEQSADLRSAVRQLQSLKQLSLLVQEPQAAFLGQSPELEQGGDEDAASSDHDRGGSEPACELVKDADVVDALLGLVVAQDAVASRLADVDQLLLLPEGDPRGGTEAAEGNRPDALLLHVDQEEGALRVGSGVFTEGAAVGEEDIAGVVGEGEGVGAEEGGALVLVDELGFCGIGGGEGDD